MIQHRIERRKNTLRVVVELELPEALAALEDGKLARYAARLGHYMNRVRDDTLDVLAILDEEELGTVKWFDEAKGYGFIRTIESKDVFVHRNGLTEGTSLTKDQRVRFKRREGRETTEAYDVTVEPGCGPQE